MKDKLSALRAKTEDYTIPDTDIVLNLRSLTFKELSEVMKTGESDSAKAANLMLFKAFRTSIPTEGEEAMTDAEITEVIDNMDGFIASGIIVKLQELSGLKDKDISVKN